MTKYNPAYWAKYRLKPSVIEKRKIYMANYKRPDSDYYKKMLAKSKEEREKIRNNPELKELVKKLDDKNFFKEMCEREDLSENERIVVKYKKFMNLQRKSKARREQKIKKYQTTYNKKNKEKIKLYAKERRESGKGREYERKHKPAYIKNRMKNDLPFRIITNIRGRLKNFLSRRYLTKDREMTSLVGCSSEELKQHIERQFLPGMTWDNYGLRGWHIDHIRPLSLAKNMEDIVRLKLLHYTNFQPLWAIDNIKKSDLLGGVRVGRPRGKGIKS